MKTFAIITLACALAVTGCERTTDYLVPNSLYQFESFRVINAYQKIDTAGESLYLEVQTLDSFLYFSKLKVSEKDSSLIVSVYGSRTPDEGFVRIANGSFLKKIRTEPRISYEHIFYRDKIGLHIIRIQNWKPELDGLYVPLKVSDPFLPQSQK